MAIVSSLITSATIYGKMFLALVGGLGTAPLAIQLAAVAMLTLAVMAVVFASVQAYQYAFAPVTSPELARYLARAKEAPVVANPAQQQELSELEKEQQRAQKALKQDGKNPTSILNYYEARGKVLEFKCQHTLGTPNEQVQNKTRLESIQKLCAALKKKVQ